MEGQLPVTECTQCDPEHGVEMGVEGTKSNGAGIDFVNSLVDANTYIKEGKFIEGVNKLDLMGGEVSQLGGDFVNVDIKATKGINGSVTDLSKFINPNSIDEIVCNNPYTTIELLKGDPYKFFIKEVEKVLKKDGIMIINGQIQNTIFRTISITECEALGFKVVSFRTELLEEFKGLKFKTADGLGNIDPLKMLSIILKKN